MAMRRIGQIFVDLGFIDDDQLEVLLEEQHQRPYELLGDVAQSLGLVTEEQVAQALAEQMSMQVISLADVTVQPQVLTYVTEPMAQLYRIIPVAFKDNVLTIAMCDQHSVKIVNVRNLDDQREHAAFVRRF